MGDSLITVENLTLGFTVEETLLVVTRDLNWRLPSGGIHALIGPSGCGKSSLLRCIAGLLKPLSGDIRMTFPGNRTPHDISLAFQSATLLPWLTVEQNALLPFTITSSRPGAEVMSLFNELLNLVDLAPFRNAYPQQLSGGMQMRAALIRTFITDSRLMLMDEPFAALDELTRERLCTELETIWMKKGCPTVLFVTHSIQEAIMLADTVTVLSDRPFSPVGDEIMIPLPRPRLPEMRLSPEFATIMSLIRARLDAGSEI